MPLSIQDKAKFVQLLGQLSPENLFADGERSQKQAAKVKASLLMQWKTLEKNIGQKVSDDQAWSFYEDVAAYERTQRANEIANAPSNPLVIAKNPGVYAREGKSGSSAYYIWGPQHNGGTKYTLFSEFAYRIVGKKEEIGQYNTLDSAVQAGEAFLSTITYDLVKQNNPLWSPETIKRELQRLPEEYNPMVPATSEVTSFTLRFGGEDVIEAVQAAQVAEIIVTKLVERGQVAEIMST